MSRTHPRRPPGGNPTGRGPVAAGGAWTGNATRDDDDHTDNWAIARYGARWQRAGQSDLLAWHLAGRSSDQGPMRGDSYCGVCGLLVFASRSQCIRCRSPVATYGTRVPDSLAGSRPRQLPPFPPGENLTTVVSCYRKIIDAKIRYFRACYVDASWDSDGMASGSQWELYTWHAHLAGRTDQQRHDPALFTDEAVAVFICGRYPPEFHEDSMVGTNVWYSGNWKAGLTLLQRSWPPGIFYPRPRERW